MPKVSRSIRFLLLWTALCGLLAVATQAALIAHAQANAPENICRHEHCGDHPDNAPKQSHDKEHCAICQVLLGPAGKYIVDTPVTALVLIGQIPSEDVLPTQILQNNTLGIAEARGPPCC